MLIEDGFKAIYLSDKIKKIILFLETPILKKNIIGILKKHLKKNGTHNPVSVLSPSAFSKNESILEQYKILKYCLNAINITFSKAHNSIFCKNKSFCGTPFEFPINRAVVADSDFSILGLLIGKMINFGLIQIKKITDGFFVCVNLNPEYNKAFEKLIISILAAIKNLVFNPNKFAGNFIMN